MTILPEMKDELAAAAGRLSRRRASRRHTARIAAIATGGVLALGGVAIGAQAVGIWHPSSDELGGRRLSLSTTAPPREQLELLGVLRRPQTEADRDEHVLRALRRSPRGLTGIRTDAVRLLHVKRSGTSSARTIVLVPAARLQYPAMRLPGRESVRHPALQDVLCFYTEDTAGWSGPCTTTAAILQGSLSGLGRDVFGLVPDGVATVRIYRRYERRPIDVPITGNFLFASFSHGFSHVSHVVWLDAAGRRIGPRCTASSAACARTARRQRAVERDAGTPLVPPVPLGK